LGAFPVVYSSLAFMFWGAGFLVFPLMPLYAVINYSVFRGKTQPSGLWGTWSRWQVNGRTPSEPGSHNPAQRC
jgi:hypothetical protein